MLKQLSYFFGIGAILVTSSVATSGPRAPETIYLNDASFDSSREFIVSNSRKDALVRISYKGSWVQAELRCDNKWKKNLVLEDNEVQIKIPKNNNTCEIQYGKKTIVRFLNDEAYSSIYKKFGSYTEECNYAGKDLFTSNSYKNMSCAHPFNNVEIMSDSIDSFLVKLEPLLGQKLPRSIIDAQDPYAELDFSKAPKLDAIYVSTLLYQNDFSGQVLARILKHHATKGTIINIIGTGYMHSDNATSLFNELMLFSKNIRIQEYKYYEDEFWKGFRFLTNYFRNMHVKTLVTLSSTSPKDNVVIIGGRNIHDGFLFQTRPDLTKFPELDQMDPEDSFAYWQDVEFLVRSKEVAETIYAHLLKFWNRDLKKTSIEPIAIRSNSTPVTDIKTLGDNSLRHFISLPFEDNHALEKLYVEMLDEAKNHVLISSPYLRPTKKLLDAILRTVRRGVKVDIQTRIDLEGDTQAWLYEETNKTAINDLYDKVGIYEWQGRSILHSKIIVIDNDLSFIGSVNLSRRSFIQDVESGFLVKSQQFNGQLRSLINNYREQSRQITEVQKRNFWATVVLYLIEDQI